MKITEKQDMEERPAYYNETKHSMHRRCNGWDYKGRGIYMLTLAVDGRKPILGELVGEDSEAQIEMSETGKAIAKEVENIPSYYPQIRVLYKQVMPDHLHFVLYVKEPLPVHIGKVISGFKSGTRKVLCAGVFRTPEESNKLWEDGYNDRILFHEGQLDAMIRYIHDNPRRLAIKRANPDLFKIRQNIQIAGTPCVILGNKFLADYPIRKVIQCSRDLRQAEIDEKKTACMAEAANGTVHISGAISEGEKQICKALREAGYPLIILLVEGFPPADSPSAKYYKPQGVYFEACAAGKLLLVQPDQHVLERPDIVERVTPRVGRFVPHDSKRYRFMAMNMIAEDMAR